MPTLMNKLKCGERAEVVDVSDCFCKRLADMGLLPGIEVECVLRCGSAACYRICDSLLAIGDNSLDCVQVTIKGKEC